CPAGDLRRAQDRRCFRNVGVGAGAVGEVCTLRRTTDAPGIERAERRDITAEIAVESAEAEYAGTGDEEGTFFRERRLEGREVHDRRISFDLAEVGIERGVESKVGAEVVLQV